MNLASRRVWRTERNQRNKISEQYDLLQITMNNNDSFPSHANGKLNGSDKSPVKLKIPFKQYHEFRAVCPSTPTRNSELLSRLCLNHYSNVEWCTIYCPRLPRWPLLEIRRRAQITRWHSVSRRTIRSNADLDALSIGWLRREKVKCDRLICFAIASVQNNTPERLIAVLKTPQRKGSLCSKTAYFIWTAKPWTCRNLIRQQRRFWGVFFVFWYWKLCRQDTRSYW